MNFLSPFLNLIFVPLLSLIIYPFSLLTLIFPIFDNTLANVLDLFENMSLIFNNITYIKFTFAKVSTPILFLYYLLIYLLIKKVSFKNILFFLILLFFHNNINVFNPESYLLFFDVGQGNAALLKLPYNQGIVLIDTGGKLSFEQAEWKKRENTYQLSDYVILPFLKSEGIKKIDYLVLTHGDIDHLGESINIINNIPVKNVFLNSNNLNNLESGIINELKLKNIDYEQIEKKEIVIRNNYIFFKSYNYSNENDSSIITYLNINNKKILLMGDASLAIEKKLVTDYNIKNINLLEIGHHGSKTSSGKKFIDIVNPKKAVISSGKNNFYGHPHQEVIDLLLNNNIDVYRTDRQGSIKYTFRNSGTIRTVLP